MDRIDDKITIRVYVIETVVKMRKNTQFINFDKMSPPKKKKPNSFSSYSDLVLFYHSKLIDNDPVSIDIDVVRLNILEI